MTDNRTWADMATKYQAWMEEVKHPERGSQPMLNIVCTPEQAQAKIGKPYSGDKAWRITRMLWLGPK